MHPIQAPPSSDPIARDFVPGPFYRPRLRETYQTTIAPDLMCLTYQHRSPGERQEAIGQRLRGWDGASPYHKNRPLRGPRGGDVLRPVEQAIAHHNVPELLAVTLSAYVPAAIKEPTYLMAARAALQAVSGARTEITRVRKGVAQFGIMKGAPAGCKVTLWADQAHELVDKMVHLVFPRIKEWRGVSFRTGDESGNVGWGFRPEEFALFPEIESNYDAYPPKVSQYLKKEHTAPESILSRKKDANLLLYLRWFLEFELWFKLLPSRTGTPVCSCRPWVSHSTSPRSMIFKRGTRCIILSSSFLLTP